MPVGLGSVALVALILLANYIERLKNARYSRLFTQLLLFINVLIMVLGIALMLLPADSVFDLATSNGKPLSLNWQTAGLSVLLMGVWGFLVSLLPIRRFLAQVLPLNAESSGHTLGLVFAGYLLGNTFFSLTQGGLEGLAKTAVSASIYNILVTQILFASMSLLGVGLYIRRSPSETQKRLGLVRPTRYQLLMGTCWIIVLVILQFIVGLMWALLDSSQAELLKGISSELLGDMDTIAEWALLAVATGTGEEILFRGALQPGFGILFTSLLFAAAHIQYGITPATFVVFVIGLILGMIRRQYNTTTSIYVHSGYNFILGMFSLLTLQLEQMIG
ncbi:MAG: hypothetical protein CSB13_06780, partial [Chloroflexi bacterium]